MDQKYEVIYSDEAKQDLNGILHYHLTQNGAAAAEKILIKIESRISDVVRMPEAYPLLTLENRTFKRQYRYVFAKKTYRILYRVVVEETTIRIITITHRRVDASRLIRSIEEE